MRPKEPARDEWLGVGLLAALAAILTSLPAILALWYGRRHGLAWTGITFLAPGDLGVYLSYIGQVKSGRWLLENNFTTEALHPVLNIFWLGVGLAARGLALSPLAAYHLVRLVLIPALAAVAYRFIAHFISEPRERLVAFAVFFFGSGFGTLLEPFFAGNTFDGLRYAMPIDLWVGEANTFLSMLYSPHFVASLALILLALHLFLRSCEERSERLAMFAGLAALFLFAFHPFHAPTLYAVPPVYALIRRLRGRSVPEFLRRYAVFAAISVPAVVYHYYLTHYDANARALLANSATPTPTFAYVMIGFGLVMIAAWFGYRKIRTFGDGDHADFLAVWAAVQLLLTYSPLIFQRRLLEGAAFPLTILSAPAFMGAWAFLRRRQLHPAFAAGIACLLLLPSTAGAIERSAALYRSEAKAPFYFDRKDSEFLAWLRRATPADSVILARPDVAYFVAGWSSRRVYVGHWSNTISSALKAEETLAFFSALSDEDRRAFLRKRGITHVVAEGDDRTLLDQKIFLAAMYRSRAYTVYVVADSLDAERGEQGRAEFPPSGDSSFD